jgi:hypothetical protein
MRCRDRFNILNLRIGWVARGMFLMRLAVSLMALAALVWLGYQFWRLLWQTGPRGAIDLKQRYQEVQFWFAGRQVYGTLKMATYPPASYALLWPFVGWLEFTPVRWLWAATTVLALGWSVGLFLKQSLAQTNLERSFVALIPLSIYATGATIGNGQLIVHILPCLVAGLLFLAQGEAQWRSDLLGACLIILALLKPSVSAPFFWIVLFVPGRLRPSLLVVCGYVGVTLLAGAFQEFSLFDLMHRWMMNSREVLAHGAVPYSHSNLHSWSTWLGLGKWYPAGSFLLLIALGVWVYFYRKAELWLLIGVTALVTRFSTYHAWYDDVLISLPAITLFRIALSGKLKEEYHWAAGFLLAITLLFMIAPGGLFLFPRPWNMMYVAGQTLIWMTVLVFLLLYTGREKEAREGSMMLSGKQR